MITSPSPLIRCSHSSSCLFPSIITLSSPPSSLPVHQTPSVSLHPSSLMYLMLLLCKAWHMPPVFIDSVGLSADLFTSPPFTLTLCSACYLLVHIFSSSFSHFLRCPNQKLMTHESSRTNMSSMKRHNKFLDSRSFLFLIHSCTSEAANPDYLITACLFP